MVAALTRTAAAVCWLVVGTLSNWHVFEWWVGGVLDKLIYTNTRSVCVVNAEENWYIYLITCSFFELARTGTDNLSYLHYGCIYSR